MWMYFRVELQKTLIAKFYAVKELERLKRVYNKAELKVLS